MEVYETEDQQVEAVKKWWKENGMSLLIGAVVGLSAVVGWKYFQSGQEAHRTQGSDMYLSIVTQVSINEKDGNFGVLAEKLTAEYADTPYASLASLMIAKYDYEHGNAEAAINKLSWVVTNANDIETQQVAQTRLIRIYLAEDKVEEAERLLSLQHPAGFDATYEELKGDLYVARNEMDKARVSYDKAISLLGSDVRQLLLLKRQELGD